ncbi:hypothetical protein Tco_0366435 [Tanacetum coccineum]
MMEKNEYTGRMPTKVELTLDQSQQGVSDDVLVSIEGVEELKRNVRIKGENKEALHTTLGRNQVNTFAIRITKMIVGIKDKHRGPSDVMHNPSQPFKFLSKETLTMEIHPDSTSNSFAEDSNYLIQSYRSISSNTNSEVACFEVSGNENKLTQLNSKMNDKANTRSPTQYKEYLSEFWYSTIALENFKINNKYAILLYCLANGVDIDYAMIFWEDFINKLKKKNKEKALKANQPEGPIFTLHMLAICKAEKPLAFKDPKTASQTKKLVSKGTKPGAKAGHKKKSTSSKEPHVSSTRKPRKAELKTLQWELPADFLSVPDQVTSVQAGLKTLDALSILFLMVTHALNKFAKVLDSITSKAGDSSVHSAAQADTLHAEGEKNTNQATISQLFQKRVAKNAKSSNLNKPQPETITPPPIPPIITTSTPI